MDDISDWLIGLAMFGGSVVGMIVQLFIARRFRHMFRNFRGGGRGGGPHPVPATGGVESSRGATNPKESKPVGPDRALCLPKISKHVS
jgi:hypothetical protein